MEKAKRELAQEDKRIIPVVLKLSATELKNLDRLAEEHADGNRSLYVRTAVLNYRPKKAAFK